MTLVRGYAKNQPLEYPTRYCPYCGRAIPRYSRLTGERYQASKYLLLKTCGDTACKGESMDVSKDRKNKFQPAQDQPIDRFIYGK